MSDYFDQIDNYLIDRLSEDERVDFESQMNSDPALKSEVETRRLLVKKIQNARIRELKTMLNGVPVVVGIGFLAKFLAPVKVVLTMATIAASISTWYYISTRSNNEPKASAPNTIEKPVIQEKKDSMAAAAVGQKPQNKKVPVVVDTPKEPQLSQAKKVPTAVDTTPKNPQLSKTKKVPTAVDTLKNPQLSQTEKTPTAVDTPTISMPDVSAESTSTKEVENYTPAKDPAAKKGHNFMLQVVVQPPVNNYPLSYKFENNTLMLYGDSGKNPYKIIDFIHTKNELYLYFAGTYYGLDTRQRDVKKVEPLTNTKLIDQLKKLNDK